MVVLSIPTVLPREIRPCKALHLTLTLGKDFRNSMRVITIYDVTRCYISMYRHTYLINLDTLLKACHQVGKHPQTPGTAYKPRH